MDSLHVPSDQEGRVIPDTGIQARISLLAQSIILTTGPVIDLVADAYRYGDSFVSQLTVTGLCNKARLAVSSDAEAVRDEPFFLLVEDSVDALVLMEAMRTQLKLQSIQYHAMPNTESRPGSLRALALMDVVRLHTAEIAYLEAERSRMRQWSVEHEVDHPGSLYDDYAVQIDWHNRLIARLAQITC